MDSQSPLQILLGAAGDPAQAFPSLLISTLDRIETKVDGLAASSHSLDTRVAALEKSEAGRGDGTKTWVPVLVSGLLGLAGLVVAIIKH